MIKRQNKQKINHKIMEESRHSSDCSASDGGRQADEFPFVFFDQLFRRDCRSIRLIKAKFLLSFFRLEGALASIFKQKLRSLYRLGFFTQPECDSWPSVVYFQRTNLAYTKDMRQLLSTLRLILPKAIYNELLSIIIKGINCKHNFK